MQSDCRLKKREKIAQSVNEKMSNVPTLNARKGESPTKLADVLKIRVSLTKT